MTSTDADRDLPHDAAVRPLEEAAAENHREMFRLSALASGGEVLERHGVMWTWGGECCESVIAFPRLPDAAAGSALDDIVAFYLERPAAKLVGCWSLEPPCPTDLDGRLLARGFQVGWRPCWMWLPLERLRDGHPRPAGLVVGEIEDETAWRPEGMPYHDPANAEARARARRLAAGRLLRFGAWLDGVPVGQSTLLLTADPPGVAGIYDVGVVERARGQGIGKAVMSAACARARALGCGHALLNATGERMYRQLGFRRIGRGWTWWLDVARLAQRQPSAGRVALAEAVWRGDTAALAALAPGQPTAVLDEPLPCEMTLMALAAHAGRPGAAEWLAEQGATLDVVSAWDLGWRERVPALLAARPELADRRSGEGGLTPLHVAVERGDADLARAVLAAGPDLAAEDPRFHATALGWARHLGRADIARLIEEHA
ncbi:MAG: GNAT family N-acetyltransferase [Chthonomonadales bacterium]|nr:GNAT family N-acetyltransferase [Chthonomonadales bacterium]